MAAASGNVAADGCEGYKNAWHAANKQLDAPDAKCKELAEEVKTLTASVAGMAGAGGAAADEITTLLDGYDVRSGGRTGIKDLLARIRVASDAKNKELVSLTAHVAKSTPVDLRKLQHLRRTTSDMDNG